MPVVCIACGLAMKCVQYLFPTNVGEFGIYEYEMGITLGVATAIDAIVTTAISFVIPRLDADFGETAGQRSLLGSVLFIGMLIGSVLGSPLGDIKGRKYPLFYATLIEGLFSILSALAPSIEMLIVCRFFSALGVGASAPLALTYWSEVIPQDVRGQQMITISLFWTFGAIFAAAVAWVVIPLDRHYGWRLYLALMGLPSFFCCVMVLLNTFHHLLYSAKVT